MIQNLLFIFNCILALMIRKVNSFEILFLLAQILRAVKKVLRIEKIRDTMVLAKKPDKK